MKTLLLALLATASLSACATRMTDTDRLAMYQANSGAPVKQIRYYNPMGWDRVDEQHVVLNMRPKESWLLRLSGPCLRWSNGSPLLEVSSQNGLVMTKFDKVVMQGSSVSCRIEEIRPLDLKGLRAAQASASAQPPSGT